MKFVILSDLHLMPEGQTSHGLDTARRLEQGVAAINARHSDADFCILAGDLADLGEEAAYERLKSIIADLRIPCHIGIGNHDDRPTFLKVFGAQEAAPHGFIDKVIDGAEARVILLDSVVDEGHGGGLDAVQLDWLRARLAEAADRPVIVVLHHHANRLHTSVDRIILENGPDLLAALKTHPDIRQVIAGHVHYTSTALWQGIPFTTLAGGHYNVTIPLDGSKADRLHGPAQMAVVLSDAEQTLVHFDNYIDGNAIL